MKFHVLIGLSHCSQISTAMWRCQYPTNAGQMTVGPKPRAARRKRTTFRSFDVGYIKTSGVLVIGPQTTSKGAVIVGKKSPSVGASIQWSSCIRCWEDHRTQPKNRSYHGRHRSTGCLRVEFPLDCEIFFVKLVRLRASLPKLETHHPTTIWVCQKITVFHFTCNSGPSSLDKSHILGYISWYPINIYKYHIE